MDINVLIESLSSAAQSGVKLYKPFADLQEAVGELRQLAGYAAELKSSITGLEEAKAKLEGDVGSASSAAIAIISKVESDAAAAKAAHQVQLDQLARDLDASKKNFEDTITGFKAKLAGVQIDCDAKVAQLKAVVEAVEAESHSRINQAKADTALYEDKLAKAKQSYADYIASLSR